MKDYREDVGRILAGRYKLLDLCGSGGSGTVFRAYDAKESREVAVKIFHAETSDNLSFLTEARAISALDDSHIVRLYDTGADGSDRYIVMEYVEGMTLRDYMDRRRETHTEISVSEILICAEQILTALAVAHSHGVIHRDIKPQNVILKKTGQLMIMDFGVAKLSGNDLFDGERHTVGTAYYLSPEQAAGNAVDARSDIYALGVLLYEMATGELPFSGESPEEIMRNHLQGTPVPPRVLNPNIPVGLSQIIETAMQKNADRRFRSADEMRKVVEKLKKNPDCIFRDFTSVGNATESGARRTAARNAIYTPLLGIVLAVTLVLVITATAVIIGAGRKNSRNLTVTPTVSVSDTIKPARRNALL